MQVDVELLREKFLVQLGNVQLTLEDEVIAIFDRAMVKAIVAQHNQTQAPSATPETWGNRVQAGSKAAKDRARKAVETKRQKKVVEQGLAAQGFTPVEGLERKVAGGVTFEPAELSDDLPA